MRDTQASGEREVSAVPRDDAFGLDMGRYHSAGQMPKGWQEDGLAAKGAKSLEKHGSSKTCVTYYWPVRF